MDSGTSCLEAGVTSTKTKILAYLGQLAKDEWVPAMKLCTDLNLRFPTAKQTLALLHERGLIEGVVTTKRGKRASFRIHPDAKVPRNRETGDMTLVPYCPPEWSDAYGKHPHSV